MKPFFISTAIDYPSEKPHLGHCLEKIQADVIARYKKSQGFDVHFSMGLDEHGRKIQKSAQKAGEKPQRFVDKMSKYYKNLWKALNISNNDFIRTTEQRHKKTVQKIVKKINKKGDIYKGKYKGLYCLDCETYYLPKDLDNSQCPVHHKPVEQIKEQTYFFRTSKYQKALLKHIKKNKTFIVPENRRNEILERLKKPLQDLSISRTAVKWGIQFPTDKKLTLFVWVDALINYLTTINYPSNKFKKFWPAALHIIGKDIIWHHSVIWPALLMSLGLTLPKTIFVHGFITVNGQKMSKSLGNVINPFELKKKYGTDAARYFLLREFSAFEDGDFSYKKLEQRYQFDLANGLGNFLARVEGIGSKLKSYEARPRKITWKSNFQIIEKGIQESMENFRFNEALSLIWKLISFGDNYINEQKLWAAKDAQQPINNLVFLLEKISHLLSPFLPETSQKISQRIKNWRTKRKITKNKPLFPPLFFNFHKNKTNKSQR